MPHKETRRVVSAASRVDRDKCAWRKLDLEAMFAAYHLVRGGIKDSRVIEELTGARIHSCALSSFEEKLTRLIVGPLPLFSHVRCGNCGWVLTEIPCRVCGGRHERYREVTPRC